MVLLLAVHYQGRHRGAGGLDDDRRPQAGGKPGTGLSGRTARLTLGRLSAALDMAVLEGKLARNVARLVTPPEHIPRERETWSKPEVQKFLAKASRDRLHAAWRLSPYGLRRGEVLGLRWSDIDLNARTLTVNQSRVLVEYQVRLEEPRSRNGKRTLPWMTLLSAR
jgi:integrase